MEELTVSDKAKVILTFCEMKFLLARPRFSLVVRSQQP